MEARRHAERLTIADDTSWPNPDDDGLEWRLRYCGTVNREDALRAACYISAYVGLTRGFNGRRAARKLRLIRERYAEWAKVQP